MLALAAMVLQSCTGARPPQGSPCQVVAGACVSARTADSVCGPARRAAADGRCVPRERCGRGLARDLVSGACASSLVVRAAARESGVRIGEDEIAICAGETELAIAGGRLGCVPRVAEGPRCPAGQVGVPPGCRPVRAGRSNLVDLSAWMQTTLAGLCSTVQLSALGMGPEPTDVEVLLRVPNNDLSLSSIEVVSPTNTGLWLRLFAPYLDALRALGGQTTTAVAEGRVRCTSRLLLPRPEPADAVGDP